MILHDGAPLIARSIHLEEAQDRAELELTNGDAIVWIGNGALAIGRQLIASAKSGHIRTLLVPLPDGTTQDIHVGPDIIVEREGGFHPPRRA